MGSIPHWDKRTKTSSPGGTWFLWKRPLSRVTCSRFAGGTDSLIWESFQMEAARLPVGAEGDLLPTPTVTCCGWETAEMPPLRTSWSGLLPPFPTLPCVTCHKPSDSWTEFWLGFLHLQPPDYGALGQSLVGWQSWEEPWLGQRGTEEVGEPRRNAKSWVS